MSQSQNVICISSFSGIYADACLVYQWRRRMGKCFNLISKKKQKQKYYQFPCKYNLQIFLGCRAVDACCKTAA